MYLNYVVQNIDVDRTIKEILLSRLQISHRLLITLKRENAIFLNSLPCPIFKTVQFR